MSDGDDIHQDSSTLMEASSSAPIAVASTIAPHESHKKVKRRREICSTCQKPKARACICASLPSPRIRLERSHVLVLEHPKEASHQNRSLPLLKLCLDDASMQIATHRRLGDQVDPAMMQTLHQHPTLFLFPGPGAISLTEGLKNVQQLQQEQQKSSSIISNKVNLLVLDATWKYAKEMNQANHQHNVYPSEMICIQITSSDLGPNWTPRRFDIRTPPSEHHLSTAEATAIVLSKLEDDGESLYDILMKPLDLMVQQWKSHYNNDKRKDKKRAVENEIEKGTSRKQKRA